MSVALPADCSGIQASSSGIYEIKPFASEIIQVYCDMETDGGGWLVGHNYLQYLSQSSFYGSMG